MLALQGDYVFDTDGEDDELVDEDCGSTCTEGSMASACSDVSYMTDDSLLSSESRYKFMVAWNGVPRDKLIDTLTPDQFEDPIVLGALKQQLCKPAVRTPYSLQFAHLWTEDLEFALRDARASSSFARARRRKDREKQGELFRAKRHPAPSEWSKGLDIEEFVRITRQMSWAECKAGMPNQALLASSSSKLCLGNSGQTPVWPGPKPQLPSQASSPSHRLSALHAADGLGDDGHRLNRHLILSQPSGEPSGASLLVDGATGEPEYIEGGLSRLSLTHASEHSETQLPGVAYLSRKSPRVVDHGPLSPSSLPRAGGAVGHRETESWTGQQPRKRKGGKRHNYGYRPH